MPPTRITRRQLLKIGAAAGAAEMVGGILSGCGGRSTQPTAPGPGSCAKLSDIDHVVILIQENRSFDHYFGSYRGVRGFSDQSATFRPSELGRGSHG
jgi:phospholipase C